MGLAPYGEPRYTDLILDTEADADSSASASGTNVAAAFAVNFTVFKEGPGDNSYHEDYLKIALDEGIGTVFTSAYDGSVIGKRVKKAGGEVGQIFDSMMQKLEQPSQPSIFAEITDDDIDNLFND